MVVLSLLKGVTLKCACNIETKSHIVQSILRLNMSATADIQAFALMSKQLAPPLTNDKHKGQAGRIAVFGGSLEYTGAPYFAAISALKVGADLSHVFCCKEAAPVIKSYSPELIVHPLLDDPNAMEKIKPWLERFHVIVIGPGLGREDSIFQVIGKLIDACRELKKPLVIDADGLFYLTKHPDKIKNYPSPGVILTPNVMELARLLGKDNLNVSAPDLKFGENVTVLRKGSEDEISDNVKMIKVSGGGSGRRCGGQGDLLAGSLATFYAWALQQKVDNGSNHDDRPMAACYAACKLIRDCNARAFKKKGRSMTSTDMLEEIHAAFDANFELEDVK